MKDALEGMVNGKKIRGRRRYEMIDNFMINGLYADTKRKAKKRVECLGQNTMISSLIDADHLLLVQNDYIIFENKIIL